MEQSDDSSTGPDAYRSLSEAYRADDADRALAQGWLVAERLGGHFDIVNDEHRIAQAIIELVARP